MRFTEDTLERAVIELFGEVGIPHIQGQNIHRVPEDVLFHDDLRNYLNDRYSNEEITPSEVDTIIRMLESFPASALYESNKKFLSLIANGFNLIREDRSKKDFHIEFLDKSEVQSNNFKIVNQLESEFRMRLSI